jgi:uroporphyrinogen-III decarboxylase
MNIDFKNFEPYINKPDVERLKRAIKRLEVDRVPNFEDLIEDRHVEKILGRYAGNTLAFGGDPAKGAVDPDTSRPMKSEDYIELCKIIGQDAMVVESIWPAYQREDENGKLIPIFDRSVKNLKEYRKLKKPGKANIDRVIKYVKEYRETAAGTKIGVTVLYGPILTYFYEFLVGMHDFMMACYEDRDFIEEMLEDVTEYWTEMTKAIVKENIDFIHPGDDVAFKSGLFLPPSLMKEIWVPRMKRIIEPAVEANIPVLFHSDGNITAIIEDLIDIGVDALNPLDPYSLDYKDLKKKFGSRIAFSGNINIEFPLASGTPEDVENDVKKHMDILKPGFGYIASSSHSIVNYIPYENFAAMINAIHMYGKY